MSRYLSLALLAWLLVGMVLPIQAQEAARKPSILFCCPGENRYYFAGYDYMRALADAGFEVDYLEGSAQLTWERISKYNVLFIFGFPPKDTGDPEFLFRHFAPWQGEYFAMVERFLKAGGGVILHHTNAFGDIPNDLLKGWGLQARRKR